MKKKNDTHLKLALAGFLVLAGLVLTGYIFCVSFYSTVSSSRTHSLYPLQSPLGCMDIFYGYVKPNLVLFLSLAAWKMTTDDKLYQGRCLSPRSAFITARSLWAKSGPVFSSSFGRLSQRLECYVHPTLFMFLIDPHVLLILTLLILCLVSQRCTLLGSLIYTVFIFIFKKQIISFNWSKVIDFNYLSIVSTIYL